MSTFTRGGRRTTNSINSLLLKNNQTLHKDSRRLSLAREVARNPSGISRNRVQNEERSAGIEKHTVDLHRERTRPQSIFAQLR